MSTFAPLTLDGVVFSPSNITGGVATWVDRTGGIPAAFAPITLQVRTPSQQAKNYRVVSKFVRPTIASEPSSCACPGDVQRQLIAEINVVIPPGSTLTEREEFLDQLQAFIASANFTGAVEDLDPVNG